MFGQTHKFIKKQVRLASRSPTEMDQDHHNTINNYFTEEFGETLSNAVFVTGDDEGSKWFGSNYFIFPIGKLHSCGHQALMI